MSTARIEQDGGQVHVHGELNFTSVVALWESTRALFVETPPTQIDLAQSRADSAGVALLVEWQLWAQQQGRVLAFVNIPAQMRALIDITGVNALLMDGSQ